MKKILASFMLFMFFIVIFYNYDKNVVVEKGISTASAQNINNSDNKVILKDGYQNQKTFQVLQMIEKCNNPDELSKILSSLYGEKISYVKQNTSFSFATNYNKGCYYILYVNVPSINITKIVNYQNLSNQESDIFLFFKPNSIIPIFVMGDKGTYICDNDSALTMLIMNKDATQIYKRYTIGSHCCTELYLWLNGFVISKYKPELTKEILDWYSSIKNYDELEKLIKK